MLKLKQVEDLYKETDHIFIVNAQESCRTKGKLC